MSFIPLVYWRFVILSLQWRNKYHLLKYCIDKHLKYFEKCVTYSIVAVVQCNLIHYRIKCGCFILTYHTIIEYYDYHYVSHLIICGVIKQGECHYNQSKCSKVMIVLIYILICPFFSNNTFST